MNLAGYVIKRIIQTIPLLFLVSLISFFLIRLAPVDPLAELKLNPSITQETLDYEVQRLGLDKPVIVQYGLWLKSFVKGDLGYCTTGEKVSDKLMERIPNTLLLTGFVILFTWLAGIPLGIVAASLAQTYRQNINNIIKYWYGNSIILFCTFTPFVRRKNRMVPDRRTYKL